MGSPPTDQPAGSVFTRGAKPTGRLPVASQASTWRVAPSSRGGTHHLGPLRQGRGGCLRLRSNDPLSPLVFSDGDNQPPWPGCTGSPLAEDPLICISSTPSDPANTSEGPSGWSQTTTGGSFLASEDMVSSFTGCATVHLGASPTEKTCCLSWGARFGIPILRTSSCGCGHWRARVTAEQLSVACLTNHFECQSIVHPSAV